MKKYLLTFLSRKTKTGIPYGEILAWIAIVLFSMWFGAYVL